MKNIFKTLFIVVSVTLMLFVNSASASDITVNTVRQFTSDELKNNVIKALLDPQITDAVNTFYSPYLSSNPHTAYYDTSIIEIISKDGYEITLEVMPYIGAHVYLGRDSIKLNLDHLGRASVIKFTHLESYDYISELPHLQDSLIAPLPEPLKKVD